ncbi:hypothetical protein ACX9R5_09815 [Rathayibacter sp. CAU 1779]
MTMTTIKVSVATRDRLKAQARTARKSLGAYLDELASRADREQRLRVLQQQIAATPPELMESYHRETAEWDAISPRIDE